MIWHHYILNLQRYFSALGTVLLKSFMGQLFPLIATSMFMHFKQNLLDRYRDILFMVRDIVKTGQSWCSVIICRKQSTFEGQFLLILVSIFWKTCVKDHRESFSRFLERRIWLVCITALLVSSFVNISAHFNK